MDAIQLKKALSNPFLEAVSFLVDFYRLICQLGNINWPMVWQFTQNQAQWVRCTHRIIDKKVTWNQPVLSNEG